MEDKIRSAADLVWSSFRTQMELDRRDVDTVVRVIEAGHAMMGDYLDDNELIADALEAIGLGDADWNAVVAAVHGAEVLR